MGARRSTAMKTESPRHPLEDTEVVARRCGIRAVSIDAIFDGRTSTERRLPEATYLR